MVCDITVEDQGLVEVCQGRKSGAEIVGAKV